ncbi:MAG: leucine-rich repeat protein [Bacteroidales bacterium]|nr:leucine-rich repeat protein [Bacteroidales bacterium]
MKKIIKEFWILAILLSVALSGYAYDFSVDGIYYGKNSDGKTVYVTYKDTNYNSYMGSVVIPSTVTYSGTTYSVTSIGDRAFSWCKRQTSVTIPNSVTSIGEYAFHWSSGLTSVTIGNSVTEIGSEAFFECTSLTSVTIPNSVTKIGEAAFCGCSGLTSVTIPNSVTSIGDGAFYNCSGLKLVTIPNTVTSIGEKAFYWCSGLTSVTIPNSVNSIGENAFYGCSGLTSVTIPNSVTSIGEYAFHWCSGLTSVTIGNSVTEIGDGAFKYCSKISSFTSQNVIPPVTSESAFEGVPRSCQLYVPASSKVAYQRAVGWIFFTSINAIGEGDIETIDSDSVSVTAAGGAIRVEGVEGAEAEVYSLSGALLYRGTDSTIALPRGVYIVKVAGTTTKVIL